MIGVTLLYMWVAVMVSVFIWEYIKAAVRQAVHSRFNGVPTASTLNLAYRMVVSTSPWYQRLVFHIYVHVWRQAERNNIYKTIPFIL